MFEFFDTVLSIIGTIIDFVVNMVVSIVMVFVQILGAMANIIVLVAYLPDLLKVSILAVVSYSVVVNTLHKGG